MIEKLKEHENETLNRHLDFFQMVRIEDEKVNTEFIRFEPGKKNIFQDKSPKKKLLRYLQQVTSIIYYTKTR